MVRRVDCNHLLVAIGGSELPIAVATCAVGAVIAISHEMFAQALEMAHASCIFPTGLACVSTLYWTKLNLTSILSCNFIASCSKIHGQILIAA